jgi:hypothetical protein
MVVALPFNIPIEKSPAFSIIEEIAMIPIMVTILALVLWNGYQIKNSITIAA